MEIHARYFTILLFILQLNVQVPVCSQTLSCTSTGSIHREYWANVAGSSLTSVPFNTAPTSTSVLYIFEGPKSVADNYGSRIRGYVCPPLTGNYIFWIASDNQSELWLSSDASPGNKVKRAFVTGYTNSREWSKYTSQKSAAVYLVAGKKYYIEAIHREGTQGDHLAVGWQLPNGVQERPIPGNRLSPFSGTSTQTVPPQYTQNVFAVIGDYGFAGTNEQSVANLVKSWKPEFIITAGDNNYPNGASSTIDANIGQYYRQYIYPYTGSYGSGADVNRFFPSLGNHDWIATGAAPYLQYFTLPGNERYYSFVKGNVHFFALDSDPHEPHGTSATSTQGTWLKNQLASSTSKWKIVYFHHSPYCSDQVHGSQPYMQWPFKSWGADIVITGHSHIYERVMRDNFPYLVNGLGGHSKYAVLGTPVSGSKVLYNSAYGALRADVKTDTLLFRFYNVNGTLIDSYPLVKSGTVTPACEAKVVPGGPTTFCSPGSVKLIANQGTGYMYQWKVNGGNITGATSYSYQAGNAGDYQVKIVAPGCTAWSSPIKVTVNTSLTSKITPGGPTNFCSGGSVTLYGNTCPGYIYQWKKNGSDIPGATQSNFVVTGSGTYQLKIVSGSSAAWSAPVGVTVTSCGGRDTSGTNDRVMVSSDSVNSVRHTVSSDSVESVRHTVSSDASELVRHARTSDSVAPARLTDEFKILVYPNPTTGNFVFQLCLEDIQQEILEIKIANLMGVEVYRKPPKTISGCIQENIELNSSLATGMYILNLSIGSKTESIRVLLSGR